MKVRNLLVALPVAAVVAALAYAAYWFHVAGELRKGVESWAADHRGQGWQVEWRSLDSGGFPGRIRLTFSEPRLIRPDGIAWRADLVTASARPYDFGHVALSAPGNHLVDWPGGTAHGLARRLDGELGLDRAGQVTAITVKGEGLSGEGLEVEGLRAEYQPLNPPQPGHDTETARFAAALYGVTLPALPGLVLDRDVALAEIAGRVLGQVPPGAPAESLAQWSAQGGTLEVDRLALDWAPMAMEADGTLALDPAGQPMAAFAARVRGFPELMDRLAEAGVIDRSAAAAAKLLLALMAKPDAQGRPVVPVPVSVQDGSVWLGPARVARLPPLEWPGAQRR